MARLFTTLPAERDIADIADYIARDNPVRALSFVRELRARIVRAAENPLEYRERGELMPGLRAARHGRYLVFFRFDGELIVVLRVLHGSRDLSGLFRD